MEFVGQTRVLVIDDDEDTRRLLKTILQPLGCAVTEGENGFEAVEHVERGSWDVVLLDIAMPGLDGLGALERIRRLHTIEELPVILLTGYDDHAVKMEGLRLRANEFLTKPFETSELLETFQLPSLLIFDVHVPIEKVTCRSCKNACPIYQDY